MKFVLIFVFSIAMTPVAFAADLAAGKKAYDATCAMCHGATGKGDGPTAAALNPKARNFTEAAWQEKTTDQRIQDVIGKGGPANGLSPLMPAFAQIKGDDLNNLVAYIRGFNAAHAKP